MEKTVNSMWDSALSPNTTKAYTAGMDRYRQFMALLDNVPVHAIVHPRIAEDTIINFIAYLHKVAKIHYSTIKLYLCGIRFHYLRHGLSSPLSTSVNNARIYTFLKSVKRSQPSSNPKRLPVDIHMLHRIVEYLDKGCFGKFDDTLMKACCTLAFFGFLRCGEFTVKDGFKENDNLCLNDVSIHSDRVVLNLKISKTDPFRKGIEITIHATNNSVCPLAALDTYIKLRNIQHRLVQDKALFVSNDGLPLTRKSFISKLKFTIKQLGVDDSLYNGHSLRIGAATTCGQLRIEDHLIKTLGRWSSDCYNRYIRTDQKTIKDTQMAMANNLRT